MSVCELSAALIVSERAVEHALDQLYREYNGEESGYGEDEIRVDTWFSDGAPVRADLSCDGHMTVQIDVTDFNLRKAETNNESTQKNMG